MEGEVKDICGFRFKNYGSNIDNYHSLPYFTVAAAIGMKKHEMESFLVKLDENFSEFYQKYTKENEVFKVMKEEELKKNEEK